MIDLAERALYAIDWLLSRLAAVVILAVMVFIVCDVFGRYAFGSPLPWVYDFVSYYVVNLVLYFLASEVLRTRSHVELDLRVRLLPARAWHVLQGLAWLAVAAVLALAAWLAAVSMLDSLRAGEIHPGLYAWPVWVEKATVAIGLGLLALRIVVRLARFVSRGLDERVLNADESTRNLVIE